MKHTARPLAFHKTLKQSHQYTYAAAIGNRVYARARKPDGAPVFVENAYAPTLYIPAEEGTHRGYDGTKLAPYLTDNIYQSKEFLEKFSDTVWGNIGSEYMLLSDTYGVSELPWTMERLYIWNIDIEVDSEGGFAVPQNPWQPITAITCKWKHMGDSGIVIYGCGDYTPKADELYIKCATEEELILRFLDDWKGGGDYPDIVTGWNVQFFDIPYLIARMKKLFTEDTVASISPFERIAERTVIILGRSQMVIDIRGVTILDYLEMYKKLTYSQQESYRLDHIAHIELKRRKLSFKEFRSLSRLYREDHQKFIEYNVNDVLLVDELDAKKQLLALVAAIAYTAKANFVDCFKQVRLWDVMIYHKLRAEGKQIPPRKEAATKKEQYAGAYVKEPKVGLHKWVCSFDVASMYPHIIRGWNLSPETFFAEQVEGCMASDPNNPGSDCNVGVFLNKEMDLEWLKSKDACMAANGVLCRRDVEGFLPNMLKTLYLERNRYKGLMKAAKKKLEAVKQTPDIPDYKARVKELEAEIASCDNAQQVRKVNLNSAYGAMGSEYFRFFDVRMAEAVTLSGQLIIQWVARDINDWLNKAFGLTKPRDFIIYSDTDSVYVDMSLVVDTAAQQGIKVTDTPAVIEMLNKFCDAKVMPIINKSFEDISSYFNMATPCLSMVRDVIADKAVWTAKKRYIMNVHDSEGTRYNKPQLKVMGLEMVKSSTPAICREALKSAMNILMNGTQDELWKLVEQSEKSFRAAPFEDIAFPRSVNGLKKYLHKDRGIPIHVRGAQAYNDALERTNLTKFYEPIMDGSKIRFANLKPENPFFSHVMAAPEGCPPEWDIEKYLDYTAMWDKSFVEPLNTVLTAAGWSTQYEESLFD
jgi:DNA polymerase elongation subunit (family B)